MKTPASKIAELAQIQPKSQFLFHKNLPPRDFSIMSLLEISFLMDNLENWSKKYHSLIQQYLAYFTLKNVLFR